MGAFGESLEKMARTDRDARDKERFDLMERHGVTAAGLADGTWEVRESGPFGRTTISLYRLAETVEVSLEGMARVSVSRKGRE